MDIEQGNFTYNTNLNHTHEGSIGNLSNDHIQQAMQKVIQKFDFGRVKIALEQLLS
jgi:argininosuccinate lyase